MINKSLNKYQTGGSAPTEDQKNDMIEFISGIKSNVDGFKDKSENEIANAIVDMSKSDEGKKSVKNLYDKFIKSKKDNKNKPAFNKLGGKIQSFICKHAKGGSVGCNCNGGITKAQGGETFPKLPEEVYNENGVRLGPLDDEKTISYMYSRKDPRTGETRTPTTEAQLHNIMNSGKDIMPGNPGNLPLSYKSSKSIIMENPEDPRWKISLPAKQKGGEIVMTQTSERPDVVLTRQQARDLAAQNYGYNNDQFTTALENAYKALYNQGFRGKELRQKSMSLAAGINRSDKSLSYGSSPIVPKPQEIVVTERPAQAPVVEEVVAQQPVVEQVIEPDYNSMSFSQAFAAARKSGAKTFIWNDKPYTTILKSSEKQPANVRQANNITLNSSNPEIPDTISAVVVPQTSGDSVVMQRPVNTKQQDSISVASMPAKNYTVPGFGGGGGERQAIVYPQSQRDATSVAETPTDSVATDNSVENTNVDYVQEYLKTHYPNGSKRNFITRIFQPYVVRENSNVETSPLFIGPLSPRYSNNAIVVGKRGSYKEGGKVEKVSDVKRLLEYTRNKNK